VPSQLGGEYPLELDRAGPPGGGQQSRARAVAGDCDRAGAVSVKASSSAAGCTLSAASRCFERPMLGQYDSCHRHNLWPVDPGRYRRLHNRLAAEPTCFGKSLSKPLAAGWLEILRLANRRSVRCLGGPQVPAAEEAFLFLFPFLSARPVSRYRVGAQSKSRPRYNRPV
jgi:hypothetical protein